MLRTKKRIFTGVLLTLCLLFSSSVFAMADSQTDRHWRNLGNYDSTVNFAGTKGRAVFKFGGTTSGDTLTTYGWGKGQVIASAYWTGFSGPRIGNFQKGTGYATYTQKGTLWKGTHISYHEVKANGSYTSWENIRD